MVGTNSADYIVFECVGVLIEQRGYRVQQKNPATRAGFVLLVEVTGLEPFLLRKFFAALYLQKTTSLRSLDL